MSYDPVLDLLIGALALILGVYFGLTFRRGRTAYDLAPLILAAILFVHQLLSVLSQGRYSVSSLMQVLGVAAPFQVLIAVLATLLIIAYAFAPDLRRFYLRRSKHK